MFLAEDEIDGLDPSYYKMLKVHLSTIVQSVNDPLVDIFVFAILKCTHLYSITGNHDRRRTWVCESNNIVQCQSSNHMRLLEYKKQFGNLKKKLIELCHFIECQLFSKEFNMN
jgi:hypothetical protein